MSLGRPEPLDPRSELVLRDGGRELRFPLAVVSSELAAWLADGGHTAYAFVGSREKGKGAKKREKLPAAFQEGPEGEVHHAAEYKGPDGEVIVGWLIPGASQRRGRELAKALGVPDFVWGKASSPGERHRTASLGEEFYEADDDRWFGAAQAGREDFLHAVGDLLEEPGRWLTVLGGRGRDLWLLLILLAGLGLGGYAVLAATRTVSSGESNLVDLDRWVGDPSDPGVEAPADDEAEDAATEGGEGVDGEDGDDEYRLDGLARWILHPSLLPALVLGLLLRRRRPEPREDLTALETESAWRDFAPILASAWFYSAAGVLVLTLARALAADSLGFDWVEDLGKRLVICFWLLPAVCWSRDAGGLLGRGFSAFYAAIFAILGLKLFLALAGLVNRMLWQAVSMFVPDLPELFQQVGDVVATLGAEGFFLMVMLSYTWSMQREQFARWNAGDVES